MSIKDLHQRLEQMRTNDNFMYWSRDETFDDDTNLKGNMTDGIWRDTMKQILLENEIKVVCLDNISSLAPELDEDKKKDWDVINQWLLELRFSGLTVILVHHMGKAKKGQRGTSARVDNLNSVIEINFPKDYNIDADGCRFITYFSKFRGRVPEGGYLGNKEFKYSENGDGTWNWDMDVPSTSVDSLIEKANVMAKLVGGMTQTAIGDEMNLTQQQVAKRVKWLLERNFIEGSGRNYRATEPGEEWMSKQIVRELNITDLVE